ncbi:hypothetical protein M5K25_027638 [Dendrobium thyrsiflorum]|uniref:Uncharacterized protein n=1 Tax=Dendrobium thyrsiflorum TaxID=117978 RepID=A0ABD0TUB2_DENTH
MQCRIHVGHGHVPDMRDTRRVRLQKIEMDTRDQARPNQGRLHLSPLLYVQPTFIHLFCAQASQLRTSASPYIFLEESYDNGGSLQA